MYRGQVSAAGVAGGTVLCMPKYMSPLLRVIANVHTCGGCVSSTVHAYSQLEHYLCTRYSGACTMLRSNRVHRQRIRLLFFTSVQKVCMQAP